MLMFIHLVGCNGLHAHRPQATKTYIQSTTELNTHLAARTKDQDPLKGQLLKVLCCHCHCIN